MALATFVSRFITWYTTVLALLDLNADHYVIGFIIVLVLIVEPHLRALFTRTERQEVENSETELQDNGVVTNSYWTRNGYYAKCYSPGTNLSRVENIAFRATSPGGIAIYDIV